MRVAFFVKSFPLVTETFILNQIIGLSERGVNVDIYALQRSDPDVYHTVIDEHRLLDKTTFLDEIPLSYGEKLRNLVKLVMGKKRISTGLSILKACNIFRYGKQAASLYLVSVLFLLRNAPPYDIIHCQFGTIAPSVFQFKEIGAITGKFVTSFRGKDATVYLKRRPEVYKNLFEKGDLFLPVCDFIRSRLIEHGCDGDKTSVLYSGIDNRRFEYRSRQLNDSGVVRIASIGRLVEKKGFLYAIQAVHKVIQTGRNIKFIIIGDGKLRSELERTISVMEIKEEVCIIGWKTHDEIVGILKDIHILVAPSITTENGDQEGIPNVLKEAMAMGIPVISTSHSGIPELVQDGVSGFIVPEHDVDELTDRIIYLIDNPEVWPVFGKAGRLFVERKFDNDILNDRLVEHYSRLINS